MDIGQGNAGMVIDDFVGGHIEVFVPDDDVLNPNAMTRNAGFAAADTRGDLDVF